MRIGKAAALITAAMLTASVSAVGVNAEENGHLRLMTAPVSVIDGVSSVAFMGSGYHMCYDESGTAFKMIYIGDEEFANWRETGVFTWKEVDFDFDYAAFCDSSGTLENEYFLFRTYSDNGSGKEHFRCRRSDDYTKITSERINAKGAWVRGDGYVIGDREYNYPDYKLFVISPDGDEKEILAEKEAWIFSFETEKYVGGFVAWNSEAGKAETDNIYYNGKNLFDATVYVADKDCNITELYSTPKPESGISSLYFHEFNRSIGSGSIIGWAEEFLKDDEVTKLYRIMDVESGEIIDLPREIVYKDGKGSKIYKLVDGIYGNNVIVETGDLEINKVLIDIRTGEVISGRYRSISTLDGEIFLAYERPGIYRLLDKNGNELCTYDNISEFYGGLAFASQDGRGFLIDRNAKRVSNYIRSVDALAESTEGVFLVSSGKEVYFVTYTGEFNDTPPEEDTDIPVTGNGGALPLAAYMLLTAAAAVISGISGRRS